MNISPASTRYTRPVGGVSLPRVGLPVRTQPTFGVATAKTSKTSQSSWYKTAWIWVGRQGCRIKLGLLKAWWFCTDPLYRKLRAVSESKTAAHELGHLLMYYGLGYHNASKISIEGSKERWSSGHVERDGPAVIKAIELEERSGRLKEVLQCYSGDAFAALQAGKADKSAFYHYTVKYDKLGQLISRIHNVNDNNDYGKARSWADSLGKLNAQVNSNQILEDSFEVVQALHKAIGEKRIDAMTQDLVQRKTIDGVEAVDDFLNKHLGQNFNWKPVQEAFEVLFKRVFPKG